jgi:hypothetical protein
MRLMREQENVTEKMTGIWNVGYKGLIISAVMRGGTTYTEGDDTEDHDDEVYCKHAA